MNKNKIFFRAGLIPFYIDSENNIKMLFMYPSSNNMEDDFSPPVNYFSYQCAKGRLDPEDNGNFLKAAIREGCEELGLKRSNIELVEKVDKTFFNRSEFFICKITDPDDFDEPHWETETTKWMTSDEFDSLGRDIHKPLVKYIELMIKNDVNLFS